MNTPISLHELPQQNLFRQGDVFVLFGELFGRGYANGLVSEARKAGMKICFGPTIVKGPRRSLSDSGDGVRAGGTLRNWSVRISRWGSSEESTAEGTLMVIHAFWICCRASIRRLFRN